MQTHWLYNKIRRELKRWILNEDTDFKNMHNQVYLLSILSEASKQSGSQMQKKL